jgi:hypothetical protein
MSAARGPWSSDTAGRAWWRTVAGSWARAVGDTLESPANWDLMNAYEKVVEFISAPAADRQLT